MSDTGCDDAGCLHYDHADTPAPAVVRVEDEGLRALSEAASPGPWTYGGVESVAGGMLYDTTRTIGGVYYEQPDDHDGQIVRHLLSPEADANGALIVACVNYVRDRLSAAPAPVGDEEAVRAALARVRALATSGLSFARDMAADDLAAGKAYTLLNPERFIELADAVLALSAPGERDNARPTTGTGGVGEHPGFCRWKGCGPPVHNWPAHQAMHAQEAREAVRRHE